MKLKNKIFIIIGIIALIGIAYFLFSGNSSKGDSETLTIEPKNIEEVVLVTGRVKPVSEISLGLSKSGRITNVVKKAGDQVYQGELLVMLEANSELAKIKEEEANLEQLKRGARPEEIDVKKSEKDKAEQDLKNAYNEVKDTLNDSYSKSEEAIRSKTAGAFSGGKISGFKTNFQTCDSQGETDVANLRLKAENELDAIKAEILAGGKTNEEADSLLNSSYNHISNLRNFIESLNGVLTQTCALNNSSLDTLRASIILARTGINTAMTNVTGIKNDISTEKKTLAKITSDLNLLLAGSDPEETKKAQAKLEDAQAKYAENIIYSPINGIITKQDAKVGQIAQANTPLVSMISSGFQVEVNIPEADISKIKVGNHAEIYLDAYGEKTIFGANVALIDPAETIVDNVPKYKVTLIFKDGDQRIKSGMTANITIITESKTNVITIPGRAIETTNKEQFVTIINNNKEEKIKVEIGIRGRNGDLLIEKGLKVGDKILVKKGE